MSAPASSDTRALSIGRAEPDLMMDDIDEAQAFPASARQGAYWLTVAFGVSSWVTVNGIFAELPLIIDQLPEGWAVASKLGLAIQAANIGPAVYRGVRPNFRSLRPVIYGIIGMGAVSMLLLARFWGVTAEFGGSHHSIALILFTFTAALCDCTSSLVYWPFVGAFPSEYVSGLALGENLSGVVASLLSWLQVCLGLPPAAFFVMLAGALLCSGVAFWFLQSGDPKKEATALASSYTVLVEGQCASPTLYYGIVGWVSLIENAVLPALLPYAAAQYSQSTYYLASTIPVSPFAILTMLRFQASSNVLAGLAVAASVASSYIVWLALASPSAPLGSGTGSALALFAILTAKALLAYTKAASMYRLKVEAPCAEGPQRRLENAGAMMQTCSLGGSMVVFALVNYTSLLTRAQ